MHAYAVAAPSICFQTAFKLNDKVGKFCHSIYSCYSFHVFFQVVFIFILLVLKVCFSSKTVYE